MHPQLGTPHNPTVDIRILAIHSIVIGNVLEIAGNRIEAKPAFWCDIAKANPARRAVTPT
jgi:hypothetical protein